MICLISVSSFYKPFLLSCDIFLSAFLIFYYTTDRQIAESRPAEPHPVGININHIEMRKATLVSKTNILQDPLVRKFIRFLSGGGLIWALRAIMTAGLTEGFLIDPVIAYRFGLGVSFVLYFFMNLHFIFKVKDRLLWRLVKYSCVSITFLSTDGLLMQMFHQYWNWHYFYALSVSTALLLLIKFFVYDRLVFQE